jgi:hypothetical protein
MRPHRTRIWNSDKTPQHRLTTSPGTREASAPTPATLVAIKRTNLQLSDINCSFNCIQQRLCTPRRAVTMVSTRATPRSAKQADATPSIDPSDYSALEPHRKSSRFTHTPSKLLLGWLFISVPLVIWDTCYILGRPHTMPGGWLHSPFWVPYALYGRVDHNYGFRDWDAKRGFGGAQGFVNAIETSMYIAYLAVWWREARPDRSIGGRAGATAVLLLYSSLVMTLSKTVLYCEYSVRDARLPCGHADQDFQG